MNLHEEQKRVQEAVNNSLAHVQEDPWLAGRVLAGMKGEEHVKRKFSFGIILVVILLVIGSLTTLAAGLEEVNEAIEMVRNRPEGFIKAVLHPWE